MGKEWKILKETHRAGFRLLKLVKVIDRDLLPLSIMEAVLVTSMPYVSLVFFANVIDLMIGKAFDQVPLMAGTMLVTLFLLNALISRIQYRTKLSQKMLQTNLEIAIRRKGMDLEYEIMSSPEIQKAIRNAEDAAKYRGGLGVLVSVYKDLLQYCLSAAVATVFIVLFCMAKGTETSLVLSLLSNPVVIVCLLTGAWLLGMSLSKEQAKKIRALEDHIASTQHEVENQLGYWQSEVLYDTESGKTIRMNAMEDMILGNIGGFMKRALPLYESMGISANKRLYAEGIESGIFSVAAYLVVLVKVFTQAISIGGFTQYAGAILQLHQALAKVAWSENEVHRLVRNLLPLADYMERENAKHTGTIPIEKREDQVYELEFHSVGFCYPGSEDFILKNINAKIDLKRKLAVVGPNGAGKTTFIKLLCRLYDPTEGMITLNGIDIRKYDYEEYLKLFSVVFQDFYLFSASIGENVAAASQYEDAEVLSVLSQAGILDFVQHQTLGIQTVIENGTSDAIDLSGGQAQKISIARALYKDAPFVILDEPTAALDPISEADIYEKFGDLVANKTSLYISHRMSSCKFCDEVIVFDKGHIVERGPHDKLLEDLGLYSRLWRAQAQYYA